MDRAAIDELKVSIPISTIAGQYTQLRRAGRELVGCCPLHDDTTPSFSVNDEKGTYHCFGCQAAGDVITLTMQLEKLEFGEALEYLSAGQFLPNRSPQTVPKVTKPEVDLRAAALAIWRQAVPLHGTVAETYLQKWRGIPLDRMDGLDSLRFACLSYKGSSERHPSLVAAAYDWRGNFVGIQRTFLRPDGTKLDVGSPKMTLGSFKGGAIQLGSGSDIIVCEGIEDGLSVLLGVPQATVWVSAGGGRMKSLELPPTCTSVVIAADNDEAGKSAAEEAAAVFETLGRQVRIMRPRPQFKDFNSDLMSELPQ